MNKKEILQQLDGRQREWIEERAREMGVTPEVACAEIVANELEKNPDLIGPNSPKSDRSGSNVFSIKQIRH